MFRNFQSPVVFFPTSTAETAFLTKQGGNAMFRNIVASIAFATVMFGCGPNLDDSTGGATDEAASEDLDSMDAELSAKCGIGAGTIQIPGGFAEVRLSYNASTRLLCGRTVAKGAARSNLSKTKNLWITLISGSHTMTGGNDDKNSSPYVNVKVVNKRASVKAGIYVFGKSFSVDKPLVVY